MNNSKEVCFWGINKKYRLWSVLRFRSLSWLSA